MWAYSCSHTIFFFCSINPWCNICPICRWEIDISCYSCVSCPLSNSYLPRHVIDTDIWSNPDKAHYWLRPGMSDYIGSVLFLNTISLLLWFGTKLSLIRYHFSTAVASSVSFLYFALWSGIWSITFFSSSFWYMYYETIQVRHFCFPILFVKFLTFIKKHFFFFSILWDSFCLIILPSYYLSFIKLLCCTGG